MQVSVEQIAKAIEINGYPIGKRALFHSHPNLPDITVKNDADLKNRGTGDLTDACALGQAALNIGASAHDLNMVLAMADLTATKRIIEMNDNGRTFKQIARYIRKAFQGQEFTVYPFDYGEVFNNYQGVKV